MRNQAERPGAKEPAGKLEGRQIRSSVLAQVSKTRSATETEFPSLPRSMSGLENTGRAEGLMVGGGTVWADTVHAIPVLWINPELLACQSSTGFIQRRIKDTPSVAHTTLQEIYQTQFSLSLLTSPMSLCPDSRLKVLALFGPLHSPSPPISSL